MSSKRQVSIVWKCFTRLEDKIVQCTECKDTLAFHKSTSTMMNHLKTKHSLKYADLQTEKEVEEENRLGTKRKSEGAFVQRTMKETIEKKLLYDLNSARRKEIDRNVLDMVVVDMQPFRIVEDKGFKRLVEDLDKKYTLPSRTKLSRSLLQMYLMKSEEKS